MAQDHEKPGSAQKQCIEYLKRTIFHALNFGSTVKLLSPSLLAHHLLAHGIRCDGLAGLQVILPTLSLAESYQESLMNHTPVLTLDGHQVIGCNDYLDYCTALTHATLLLLGANFTLTCSCTYTCIACICIPPQVTKYSFRGDTQLPNASVQFLNSSANFLKDSREQVIQGKMPSFPEVRACLRLMAHLRICHTDRCERNAGDRR